MSCDVGGTHVKKKTTKSIRMSGNVSLKSVLCDVEYYYVSLTKIQQLDRSASPMQRDSIIVFYILWWCIKRHW